MLNEPASLPSYYQKIEDQNAIMGMDLFLKKLKSKYKHYSVIHVGHVEAEIREYSIHSPFEIKELYIFLHDIKYSNPMHMANIEFVLNVGRRIFNEFPGKRDIKFNSETNCYFFEASNYIYTIPFEILDIDFYMSGFYGFRRERKKPKKEVKPTVFNRIIEHVLSLDIHMPEAYTWTSSEELTGSIQYMTIPPKDFDGQEDWILAYLIYTRISALFSE